MERKESKNKKQYTKNKKKQKNKAKINSNDLIISQSPPQCVCHSYSNPKHRLTLISYEVIELA